MPEPFKLTRIPSLKTVEDFRSHAASLGVDLPCEDAIVSGPASPLAQPVGDRDRVRATRIGAGLHRAVLPSVRADHRVCLGNFRLQLTDLVAGAGGVSARAAQN